MLMADLGVQLSNIHKLPCLAICNTLFHALLVMSKTITTIIQWSI